jgi:hypothetical protein
VDETHTPDSVTVTPSWSDRPRLMCRLCGRNSNASIHPEEPPVADTLSRYQLTADAMWSEKTDLSLVCGTCPAHLAVAHKWPDEDGVDLSEIHDAMATHDRVHERVAAAGTYSEARLVLKDGAYSVDVTTLTNTGTTDSPHWSDPKDAGSHPLTVDSDRNVTDDHVNECLAVLGFAVAGPWQNTGVTVAAHVLPLEEGQ